MPQWVEDNWIALVSTAAGTVVLLVAGLILVRVAILRLPSDFLTPQYQTPRRSPAWRIAKNVLGGILALAGLAMLMLPGPGILVVLLGLTLLDFPGRHRLIAWIASRERVLNYMNRIRRRHGKPDLQPPQPAQREA